MAFSLEVEEYLQKQPAINERLMREVFPVLLSWVCDLEMNLKGRDTTASLVVYMIGRKICQIEGGERLPDNDRSVTTNPQDQLDSPHYAMWDNQTATFFFGKIFGIIGAQPGASALAIFEYLTEMVKITRASGTS